MDLYRYFGSWAAQKVQRILGPMKTPRKCGSGRPSGGAVIALLAASLPLAAGPINVTNQTTASLNADDALFFTLATYGFGIDANEFGISPYPAVVSFSFVSSPPGPGGLFDAVLETPGGSVIAPFPELLEFVPGQYQGASYSGPVGEIEGSLKLSPALSQQLFSGASAVLVLQNLGPEASVGLSSYAIAHDLTVSLSGGGLSYRCARGAGDSRRSAASRGAGTGFGMASGNWSGAVLRGSRSKAAGAPPKARCTGHGLVIRRAKPPPGRPTRHAARV